MSLVCISVGYWLYLICMAGGYKATLNSNSKDTFTTVDGADQSLDPNTSAEAKAHAREVLEREGYAFEDSRPEGKTEQEHKAHVIAGYKAALHSK